MNNSTAPAAAPPRRWSQLLAVMLIAALLSVAALLAAGTPPAALGWKIWHQLSKWLGPAQTLSLVITPPPYTQLAPLTLATPTQPIAQGMPLHLAPGSTLALVLNGETTGQLRLNNTWQPLPAGVALTTAFQAGNEIAVRRGPWLVGYWPIAPLADQPPQLSWRQPPEILGPGQLRLPLDVQDDYGLARLTLEVALAQQSTELLASVPLPLPPMPHQTQLSERSYTADLGPYPLAGLQLQLRVVATDVLGQQSKSPAMNVLMPARQFSDALASRLAEIRLQLQDAGQRLVAANEMAMLTHDPQVQTSAAMVLALRSGAVRLILDPTDQATRAVSQLLWEVALQLEQGGRPRTAETR